MAEVETKHAKFLRISEGRVARAEESIRLLENLSSRDYEPGPGEAAAMIARLDAAVDKVRALFGLSRPAVEAGVEDLEGEDGEEGSETREDLEAAHGAPAPGVPLKPGYVVARPKPSVPKANDQGVPYGWGDPPPRHLVADLLPPGYPTPAEDDLNWRFNALITDAWMSIHHGDSTRAKEILSAITSS